MSNFVTEIEKKKSVIKKETQREIERERKREADEVEVIASESADFYFKLFAQRTARESVCVCVCVCVPEREF